eukprot:757688_1
MAEDKRNSQTRMDGRLSSQFRPIECEQGLLHRADGSCLFKNGKSSVLVGIYGPLESDRKEELIDRACIDVVYKPLSGIGGFAETARESQLMKAIEPVILGALHPRTTVTVVVQILRDDGALLATCLCAIGVALMDCGIPCNSSLSAVAISAGRSEEGEDRRVLRIDPTSDEEQDSQAMLTIGFCSKSDGILFSDVAGQLIDECFMEAVSHARKACATGDALIRSGVMFKFNI